MKHKRETLIELLDLYSSLLTEHQNEIMSEYFYEDLSMIEISENYNISKAAVSDIINRCIKQLEEYENKLNLLDKLQKTNKIISDMHKENIDILEYYANKLEEIEKEK